MEQQKYNTLNSYQKGKNTVFGEFLYADTFVTCITSLCANANPIITNPFIYEENVDFYGCTDPFATNFNPYANIDDGSCTYRKIYGCTDSNAINYNPNANTDNGSCRFEIFGCLDPLAQNYDSHATADDGTCFYPPPVFTLQPQSSSILLLNSYTLTSQATSLYDIQYQWRRNNVNIAGATSKNYTIDSMSNDTVGYYDVKAYTIYNGTLSNTAFVGAAGCSCVSAVKTSGGTGSGSSLMFKLPCNTLPPKDNCACPLIYQETGSFIVPEQNKVYQVTFRIRGIAEASSDYDDIGTKPFTYIDNIRLNPSGFYGPYNSYQLQINNNVYLLNYGPSGNNSRVYDFTMVLSLTGNTSYTLYANSYDSFERYLPVVAPDNTYVTPIRVIQPYAGQFMQLDVVSVTSEGKNIGACCGCNQLDAINFNPLASINNGTCVYLSPVFSSYPASSCVLGGSSYTLYGNVSSVSPLTYQWKKNGANIIGATSKNYTIPSMSYSNVGTYNLVATTLKESITSGDATVGYKFLPDCPSGYYWRVSDNDSDYEQHPTGVFDNCTGELIGLPTSLLDIADEGDIEWQIQIMCGNTPVINLASWYSIPAPTDTTRVKNLSSTAYHLNPSYVYNPNLDPNNLAVSDFPYVSQLSGCNDPVAVSYDPLNNISDGSCLYGIKTNFYHYAYYKDLLDVITYNKSRESFTSSILQTGYQQRYLTYNGFLEVFNSGSIIGYSQYTIPNYQGVEIFISY